MTFAGSFDGKAERPIGRYPVRSGDRAPDDGGERATSAEAAGRARSVVAWAAALMLGLGSAATAPTMAQEPGDAPAADTAVGQTPDTSGQAARETPLALLPDEPPPNWAPAERARSRECVPILERLEAVESDLVPRQERMQRIEALHRAVSLEDSLRVSPLDRDDPLERAVGEWFRNDLELANRYLETEDEAVREERRAAREAMLARLEEAHRELNEEVTGILESNEELQAGARRCRGRTLLRDVVLEACEGRDAAVCEAARSEEPGEEFSFVESAEALWNVEQFRPWSEPGPLRPTPFGGLGGARTETPSSRGNARVVLGLEPTIQARAELSAEEVAQFEEHLDSLGIEFEHPDLVTAPALTFEIDVPGRLGGETHYLLHFGDLSDPQRDVVHVVPVPDEWPMRGFFLPSEETLVRLARGDAMSLTAVRLEQGDAAGAEGATGEPVFTIGFTPVLQAQRVAAVLRYMMSGDLESDLTALVSSGEADPEADSATAP